MSMYPPFTPATPTVSAAPNNSTARVALTAFSADRPKQVLVSSPAGGALAFVKFGDSTVEAAATDTPILPGTQRIFTIAAGVSHGAAFAASSTTIYFTSGQGAS